MSGGNPIFNSVEESFRRTSVERSPLDGGFYLQMMCQSDRGMP
jgi:hypothetical protein